MKKIMIKKQNLKPTINNHRYEDMSKRTKFSKTYVNDNGTKTIKLSYKPMHYFDKKANKFEEISNKLNENGNKLILNYDKTDIAFSKKTGAKEAIFSFSKEEHKIDLFYKGKKEIAGNAVYNTVDAKREFDSKNNSKIVYKDITKGIDLEYKLELDRVKENIVVNQKSDSYEFLFDINIGKLNVRLSNNEKELELFDENNIVQFIIPAPYMFDSNGEFSNDVFYEIEEIESGKLTLSLKADKNWINDINRKLPVIVDPQVVVAYGYDDENIKMYAGTASDTSLLHKNNSYFYELSSITDLVFMGINLSSMQGKNIFSVSLDFDIEYITSNLGYTLYIYDYLLASNSNILGVDMTEIKHFSTMNVVSSGETSLDITSLFKSWLDKQNTVGVLLFKLAQNVDVPAHFFTPVVTITYNIPSHNISDYLNTENDIITETILNIDIEIETTVSKLGLLTTYIDRTNNVLFQTFQDDSLFYTRKSIDLETWGNWKKHTMRGEVINGTLYLSDE